ncbi:MULTISPECIES: hypothetical protein [Pseudomonas]|uniref:hypothetical protein n=1 Tax=Pseudomonas TaxID=286 RepID=UPI001F61EF51|nr:MULTISPECIES: hypothetical protein [Pseudomonas]MDH0621123.1 hypothetical protein [Pseudomonas fulva]UNT14633.1 hypothetical protein MOP87_05285 [Pseudomonas sp. I3-I5]
MKMTITTKIQQIISELQAAEELLHKQALPGQTSNARQVSTLASVNPTYSHQKPDNSASSLGTLPGRPVLQEEVAIDLTPELERLRNENQRLSRELYDIRKESLISKNAERQALSENELLVVELTKVQSELEQYFEDKIALEAALANTNELIEKASKTIESLQCQSIFGAK